MNRNAFFDGATTGAWLATAIVEAAENSTVSVDRLLPEDRALFRVVEVLEAAIRRSMEAVKRLDDPASAEAAIEARAREADLIRLIEKCLIRLLLEQTEADRQRLAAQPRRPDEPEPV